MASHIPVTFIYFEWVIFYIYTNSLFKKKSACVLSQLLVAMEIYCASVVEECKRQLVAAGYSELRLKDSWDVKKGGKVSIV